MASDFLSIKSKGTWIKGTDKFSNSLKTKPEVPAKNPDVSLNKRNVSTENPNVSPNNRDVTTKNPDVPPDNRDVSNKNPNVSLKNRNESTKNPNVSPVNINVTAKNRDVPGKNPDVSAKNECVFTGLPACLSFPGGISKNNLSKRFYKVKHPDLASDASESGVFPHFQKAS